MEERERFFGLVYVFSILFFGGVGESFFSVFWKDVDEYRIYV